MKSSEFFLSKTSLFVNDLPSQIERADLWVIFKGFQVLSITINANAKKSGNQDGWWQRCVEKRSACVEFISIPAAEKALAVLNLSNIPNTRPPALLKLSPSQDPISPPPLGFTGNPRFVKLISPSCTSFQLYDIIRPFGPLASARIDKTLGAIVQFWTEDSACSAGIAVRSKFARTSKITLEEYDPCKLFCSNLSVDMDKSCLEAHFKNFGVVRNPVYITIFYFNERIASEAFQTLNGTIIDSKAISLRYYEPNAASKLLPVKNERYSGGEGENAQTTGIPDNPSNMTSDDSKINHGKHENLATEFEELRLQFKRLEKQFSDIAKLLKQAEKDRDNFCAESKEWKRRLTAAESEREIEADRLRKETRAKNETKAKLQEFQSHSEQLEQQLSDKDMLLKQAREERDKFRDESEEWRRKYTIADSRRKIVELEADRPLWENVKRQREMREKAEAEKAMKEEEARKKAEFEQRVREQERQREMGEKIRKAREAEAKRAREARERAERELREEKLRLDNWKKATATEQDRCRQRDIRFRTNTPLRGEVQVWTDQCAVERFIFVSDEFGQIKFSEAQPLTFGSIPWPVLDDPVKLAARDITWSKVEAFFAYMEAAVKAAKYNTLVEKIHRLFHPDKWRAKRILETVMDTALRKALESAGNTVSQAITPIWRETKDGA